MAAKLSFLVCLIALALPAQMVIRRAQPIYPPLAKAMRIHGTVHMQAVIDVDGTVAALKLVSGHPLLVNAAMDAAKQYRYAPLDKPAIVSISITLSLDGGPPSRAATVMERCSFYVE